ncbi:glycosyltransferase family 9 protein [Acetobacter sp. TBRC 12305]|uniref:Glycosyltransferase family 9 protein n=1 Tax=Acetobacter garciniae TaxID=2817435 RepID=A0A939HQK8_9PROT|nr:glycosyltransferase family 9 protein [Acetobacter garciniae]MBO1326624.1 glycosyltransferase family 9 protein [Acetobacter garciniae]MBX0346324.1 glycosyltransferase family 9 protein [Acetobacter garciniae]
MTAVHAAEQGAGAVDARHPVRRILVIRLGALGDFVHSFGPFQAIRRAYPQARITLLTTRPFMELARLSPWFDTVEEDTRPRWLDWRGLLSLRRRLRGYDRVFDLQTSGRTARYFRLAGRPAGWSGHVAGASLAHANPWRNDMHTHARQRDQLRMAGLGHVPEPDMDWLAAHASVTLPQPYALLVPGASVQWAAKRWPAHCYGELARILHARGIRPVIVGTNAEKPLAAEIQAICPQALDLVGRTTLPDLAGLAAHAWAAVGNDTGPLHLAAMMGCRCLALFSRLGDPALAAPMGREPGQVRVLWVRDLALLPVQRVAAALW